jgi:hypothetical protein
MRPMLATAAIRQLSPRKMFGKTSFPVLRNPSFRDESPMRQRSGSVKRKPDDTFSYAAAVSTGNSGAVNGFHISAEKLEQMSVDISTVNSICDKIDNNVNKIEDPEVATIMGYVSEALKLINKNHSVIVNEQNAKISSGNVSANPMISLGNISKRNRSESALVSRQTSGIPPPEVDRTVNIGSQQNNGVSNYFAAPEEDPAITRFKEAVEKAESSTLIFNLNLGKVPIMNVETMSKNATLALTAMAAEVENRPGSIPTDDTVTGIDDILSVAQNIEFYGKKTKSYTNPKDNKSGSFCTVPVKYEFSDRETRIEAETFLRQKCGVNCATPYPVILRECIKQCIDKVKSDYPDNQVKVAVDTKRFCLRVARRCTVEGSENYGKKWNSYEKVIPLPKEVLNVETRKVPEGFKMDFLPPGREKGQAGSPVKKSASGNADSMEVELPLSPAPPPGTSRPEEF